MNKICLFDVDGTLTPSRQPMDGEFAKFFIQFVEAMPTFLVSGSDYAKLKEQVPQNILHGCKGVFGCSGSEYFEVGEAIYRNDHTFNSDLERLCENFVKHSAYPLRRGNHIEKRVGMLNISVVGRNASFEERSAYHHWDKTSQERAQFVESINDSKLGYEASAGGEISVDIVPTGWNKSVAKEKILDQHPHAQLIFFGDRICDGGNDLPLAQALTINGSIHEAISVQGYTDTWAQISKILNEHKIQSE